MQKYLLALHIRRSKLFLRTVNFWSHRCQHLFQLVFLEVSHFPLLLLFWLHSELVSSWHFWSANRPSCLYFLNFYSTFSLSCTYLSYLYFVLEFKRCHTVGFETIAISICFWDNLTPPKVAPLIVFHHTFVVKSLNEAVVPATYILWWKGQQKQQLQLTVE